MQRAFEKRPILGPEALLQPSAIGFLECRDDRGAGLGGDLGQDAPRPVGREQGHDARRDGRMRGSEDRGRATVIAGEHDPLAGLQGAARQVASDVRGPELSQHAGELFGVRLERPIELAQVCKG